MSTLGKTVIYVCTEEDSKFIESLREQGQPVNPVKEGDQLPGIVTADWNVGEEGGHANVVVTLDGQVLPLWKTSIPWGFETGQCFLLE